MKARIMKAVILGIAGLCLLASPAAAQNARLQIDHLDKLFPKAVETIDVSLEGSMLQVASKFLSNKKADEAAIREMISALKGVYVKGVEFDKEGEFSEADVETVRNQLRSPGWERIVGVRSKKEGENVEVYLMLENGLISGVGVLVIDPKQLFVVNVVGPIDPEKIGQLRGSFGIPDSLDLDWGGARKTRKSD